MGGSYQRQTVFSVSAMCRVFRETTPKEEENARGPRVCSPSNLARANDDALTKRDLFDTKYLRSSYQGFTTEKQSSISQRISSNDPDFLQSRFAVSLKKLATFVYPLCV